MLDEDGGMAVLGGLLIGVGPAEQVAIFPLTGGDFEAKGQAACIEAAGDDDGGNADGVDPAGIAVWSAADAAVLRHGLIGWGNAGSGIDQAVEMEAVEGLVVGVEGLLLRVKEVCARVGVGLEDGLFDRLTLASASCARTGCRV